MDYLEFTPTASRKIKQLQLAREQLFLRLLQQE
jgi:hypothetical protein